MKNAFLLTLLLICVSWAAADISQGNSGNWQYSNEYFAISVNGNGNVPKFTFWYTSDPATQYFLRFQQLFEASWVGNRLKKYGPSNIALPSLDWSWTPVVQLGSNSSSFQQYTFNISSSYPPQFDLLRFTNVITVTNGNLTGKIDVEIDNYRWVSPDSNAKLVLLFRLSTFNDNSTSEGTQQDSNTVVLAGAWFKIAPTAIALPSNTVINVNLQYVGNDGGEDGNGIWVIYDHFSGSLIHDPDFGLSLTAYGTFVFAIIISVCGFVAVVVVAVIIYVIHKRNSRRYN
jgi:hypothetical protein